MIIRTENLSKTFRVGFWGRKFEALQDLSLEVGGGEIFGLLGPNGAGKTTTLKLLMGLLRPTRGRALVLGKEVGDIPVRRRVGYLPESPYFYDHLKGAEFLDFYGRLFSLPRPLRHRRVQDLLERVGIAGAAHLPLRKYSKGMLQRIGLAQALINDPELVILDEPMTGLDPVGRREIRDLILGLKKEGKTVCFSSHILSDAEMICDRVGIINRGRLAAVGDISQLLNPRVAYYEICCSGIGEGDWAPVGNLARETFRDGELFYAVTPEAEAKEKIIAFVQKKGGRINSVVPHRESLEEYFLRQVGKAV